MTAEDWLEEQGKIKVSRPGAWLTQAGQLRAAGDAINEDQQRILNRMLSHRLGDTRAHELITSDRMWTIFSAVMLWGFALENLLKGLLVARRAGTVTVSGLKLDLIWKGKNGHNLVWLASGAGEDLTNDERELLNKLTLVTRWGGRYPLPFDLGELRPTDEHDGPLHWSHRDSELLTDIYERLSGRLATLSRQDDQRQSKLLEAQQRAQYSPRLSHLETTCSNVQCEDGATLYRTDEPAPIDVRGVVHCTHCGAQFTLGGETRGALCRCGTLYAAGYRYDPAMNGAGLHTEILVAMIQGLRRMHMQVPHSPLQSHVQTMSVVHSLIRPSAVGVSLNPWCLFTIRRAYNRAVSDSSRICVLP
jgi:hypothetical protein